jgi:hypothetical protein
MWFAEEDLAGKSPGGRQILVRFLAAPLEVL